MPAIPSYAGGPRRRAITWERRDVVAEARPPATQKAHGTVGTDSGSARTPVSEVSSAVQTHRPHIEVVAAGLATLGKEVRRFDPHLVICSRPNTVEPGGSPAWVELPPNPEQLAEFCIDGQSFEIANPALEELSPDHRRDREAHPY